MINLGIRHTLKTVQRQFVPNVVSNIEKIKKGIEVELKEFIAIQRWKDINFYARKEAAAKIRRQLFKFVKKLRESLVDKGVEPLLVVKSDTVEASPPVTLKLATQILADDFQFDILTTSEKTNLKRAPRIRSKCIQMNQDLTNRFNTLTTTITEDLTEFGEEVKERFDQMSKETQNIPAAAKDEIAREKRISAVKSLLTKKRRALFDLFTVLKETGVSFKKGLNLSRDPGMINNWFRFSAGNDSEAIRSMRHRVANRFTQISAFLRCPDKAVSKNEYDRVLGYCFHLANIVTTQRTARDNLDRQTKTLQKIIENCSEIVLNLQMHIEVTIDHLRLD